MVGKTRRALKNERDRMDIIAKHCGCLPCLLMGYSDVHTTIEHVTNRGRRLENEHMATIGLCVWHHFGHTQGIYQAVTGERGPTLVAGRHIFEAHFGDEVKVLLPCQDFMISLFYESPWLEYTVPRRICRQVRNKWIEINAAI